MSTNGVNADGLNRLVNADFFLVNGDIKLLFQCSGNFFARDRTEKPSVFAGFAVDFYGKLAHVRCKSLCVFALNFNAMLGGLFADVCGVDRACIGGNGQTSRNQEIACVAIADGNNVSGFACAVNILFEHNFHSFFS